MIQIVMKPDYDVKPENRENCYKCIFNGEDVGLRVWGQRASHAEEKMMVIFREQLNGKEVDYDLEEYRKSKASKGEDEVKPEDEKRKEERQDREQLLPGME